MEFDNEGEQMKDSQDFYFYYYYFLPREAFEQGMWK